MNETLSILTAPFYALFSVPFYRKVITSPLSRGFLYAGYLSLVIVAVTVVMFFFVFLPKLDAFEEWIETEMPALTWTPEGLVMDARSPYLMVHPELGPLAIIDTTKEDIASEEMGHFLVYVTSKRIFTRQGPGEIRVYDITQPPDERREDMLTMRIDPELVNRAYRSLRPWISFFLVAVLFPFFFIWKVMEALIYSLVGSFINFKRRNPLTYSATLNVSFFALTAATILQYRRFFLPFLGRIPFGFFGGLLVTSLYLFFILRKTDEPPVNASSS